MYYCAIDILAIAILLIENFDIFTKRGADFSNPKWSAFRNFLISVLAFYGTDVLWSVFEMRKLALAMFIDTSLYFVAMAVSVLFWIKYVIVCLDKEYRLRRTLLWAGRAFAASEIALVIVNCFTPVLFTVDSSAVYHELRGRNLVLLGQIAMLVFVSGYALYYIVGRRTNEKSKYRTMAIFGIIMASFLGAQLRFPYLPLYAIGAMFGTSLLHNYVIVDEMKEAKKISALRQSMTSLLDNMPVMSYSKDIETGIYVACNQTFSNYAKNDTPESVIGLTDAELFGSDIAASFVLNDKTALESDGPYIYYEEVTDRTGNTKHFQTTKLKYNDETGKELLLGMSLDITEMVSAKKENELTKAAYQEAVSASTIYESIVGMLSKDYFDIYYVDINTNEFVEYGAKTEAGHHAVSDRGDDFFASIKADAPRFVYAEDRSKLMEVLEKDNLLKAIEKHGVFIYYYRLMIDGKPTFVALKATRVAGDEAHIIIGINNVDAQMQSRIDIENAKKERKAYERLNAFSRNLLVLYVVDPETDDYIQYSSVEEFDELEIKPEGSDFFEETFKNSLNAIHPDDQSMFHHQFTKEKILEGVSLDGIFVMEYRLVINGEPIYVRLKVAEVEEDGKQMLVVGLEDVDTYVRREKQQEYELSVAREKATKDALTGVSNSHAFNEEKHRINENIKKNIVKEIAVVICDINGLKVVNDTLGHKSGDEHIRKACAIICDAFKHSRVYRIGGDEFAVICQGRDYENIDELLQQMDDKNRSNPEVQVAFGMARFAQGESFDDALVRADRQMYEYKAELKGSKDAPAEIKADAPVKYRFPEELKRAYESSALSFVYYQNINDSAVPVLASDGFCRNSGMPREKVLDWLKNGMFERMHPDDVGVLAQISDDFLHQRGPYDTIFRCRLSNSEVKGTPENKGYVYIHGLGQWQTMPDGTQLAVITYSNLSRAQEKTIEKQIKYKAQREDRFYTDPLTKIPNFNYLNEFGAEKVKTIRADGKTPNVVYIDIYSMQSYNSQYGIKEGDKLLCLTADTLVNEFKDSLVVRSVDDHFIVLTAVPANKELEKALHRVNRTIRKNAQGNTSGIRSGVCSVDEDITLTEAIDRAKITLKRIENNMNREVEFFSQVSNQIYFQDRYIIENFPQALKKGYINVYAQAVIRVESQKVAALERLARWVDPERGMIYPKDFIPVLLKYHQLYKLDLYMFEKACRDARSRYDEGLSVIPVTINFSRQDFDHIDVLKEMNKIYDKYDLDGKVNKDCFIVEITEQDLATAEDAFKKQLKNIRQNNYKVWIDDFGSGYSGISTFSQYDFDLIKFDMNLLRHLDDNGGANRLILEQVVYLAHELHIHTLAEGLENDEQLEFVKEIGCELAQGYYYQKPEPIEDIIQRINSDDEKWKCESPEERDAFNRKWSK